MRRAVPRRWWNGAVTPQIFIGAGTVINVSSIVVGSAIGLLIGQRLSQATRNAITTVLSLVVIVIGVDAGMDFSDPALAEVVGDFGMVVVMLCLVVGTLIGRWLRLAERLDQLGQWGRRVIMRMRRKDPAPGSRDDLEGFVTAVLIFCVGPLGLLGALQDGLGNGPSQLCINAVLDGFTSIALASTFGASVMGSAIVQFCYLGSITFVGFLAGGMLPDPEVAALNSAGGIILLSLGLTMAGVRRLPVVEVLPALVLAPATVWGISLL